MLLCVLVALLILDKRAPSVLASVFVVLLLEIDVPTPEDFVAWLVLSLGKLGTSFLCDGVGNGLGTVCGTAVGGTGRVEPFAPVFNKVLGFVESKFLEGDATPSFLEWFRVD